MLRPPEPDQVKPDAKRQGHYAIECSAIRNRHSTSLFFLRNPAYFTSSTGLRFFERRLDRFVYGRVSFPALILQCDVLDRDRIRIGVEIGQDFIF